MLTHWQIIPAHAAGCLLHQQMGVTSSCCNHGCCYLQCTISESSVCGCRVFGTVSYYVQKLFSEFQGVWYVETSVSTPEGDPHDHGVAASATCQDDKCTQLAFKVRTSLQTSPSDTYMTTALLMKRYDVLAAHSAGRQVGLGMVLVSGMVLRLVLPVEIACNCWATLPAVWSAAVTGSYRAL